MSDTKESSSRALAEAPAKAGVPVPYDPGTALGEPGRRGMGVVPSMGFGAAVLAVFLGGFGAWAALASLEIAAFAPGLVGVSGERKTVQHLEGGIVGEIRVAEGDKVASGQVLIVLDDTRARASLALIQGQYRSSAALKARLDAERDGLAEIRWPRTLRRDRETRDLVAAQQRILQARAAADGNRVAIHEQRIAQLREQSAGLEGQIAAQGRELGLLREEMRDVAELVERGHARKPRLLALRRREAVVSGMQARNRAEVARIGQTVGESRLKIMVIRADRLKQVVARLREVEQRLSDLGERMTYARDVVARTRIVAPTAGRVVGLSVFTRGGVIDAGQKLMDIVPDDDQLVIEARVAPTDVDVVAPGLPAQVRLTAFSQLNRPPLEGTVRRVSADSFTDRQSGESWYEALITLDPDQPGLSDLELVPGMPADVMIVSGARTPLDYLLKPIVASLGRALREQ